MKTEAQKSRSAWLAVVSLVMALLLALSSLASPQMITVSYAKYISEEEAGVVYLSADHAHALLTTGFKLNRALATGTTTSGAVSDYKDVPVNTSLTEVYFGTPAEYASQIEGITGVDVSYYGDGSIKLYKNGTKAYIVSDRTIAACEHFGSTFERFTNLTKVHFSEDFDTSRTNTFAYMFFGCTSLASIENLNTFDTSNTTSMQSMFYASSPSLKSIDLSSFNTAKVEDMGSMFRGNSGLSSIDVSGFDTSNVWDMGGMFEGCSSLSSIDVTGFDTSKAETMQVMFQGCTSLETLDLRSFSCESLENMDSMFANCTNLTTIYADYGFDCRGISNPAATDEKDANGNYKTDSDFVNIFKGCTKLVGGAGTKYDAKIVHNLRAVVDVQLAVEQTVFQSSVGYFTHYSGANPGSTLLKNGQNLNAAIKTLANGSSKAYTFEDTAVKNIYFGKTGAYNVSGLKSVNVDAADKGTIKAYWNPSNGAVYVLSDYTIVFGSSSDYMFDNFRSVNGIYFDNISTSGVRTMQRMFSYCLNLTNLDLSMFETHNVVDYGSCFRDAAFTTETAQNNIIPYLDTSKARDIGGLFMYCEDLTGSLDLSSLSCAKAETIASIVQGCTGITSVNISGFTVPSVLTNCSSMFDGCTNLQTIYTNANFNLNKPQITNGGNMFTGCTKLVGGNGTKFSASNVTYTYARPDAAGSAGYFTSTASYSLRNVAYMTMTAQPIAPEFEAEDEVSSSDLTADEPVTSPSDAPAVIPEETPEDTTTDNVVSDSDTDTESAATTTTAHEAVTTTKAKVTTTRTTAATAASTTTQTTAASTTVTETTAAAETTVSSETSSASSAASTTASTTTVPSSTSASTSEVTTTTTAATTAATTTVTATAATKATTATAATTTTTAVQVIASE